MVPYYDVVNEVLWCIGVIVDFFGVVGYNMVTNNIKQKIKHLVT